VTDDGEPFVSGLFFLGRERASLDRRHAQHREECGRHVNAGDTFAAALSAPVPVSVKPRYRYAPMLANVFDRARQSRYVAPDTSSCS
jgi:hypothetical protein